MKFLIAIIYIQILGVHLIEFDKLVFEENFEGPSLNLSKWEYDIGNGVWGWGNDEKEYYRKNKENIYIENNQLHIKAKVESYGNMEYTSAKITTKHTFQFTYGYVEAKIKLPIGKGIWPAFWMLGANIDDINWPDCGEIDILEAINEEKKIYHTLHWRKGDTNEQGDEGDNKEVENIDEFHKYGLKWTEEEISMYIDDIESFKISLSGTKTEAFHKPFYLLLNLAVGGLWPGYDIDNSAFPLEMVIDYIKIYQSKENYKYLEKHLIFYDDFNDEELDSTKWDYDIGAGTNGWGTYQKQYYTKEKDNVFLSDSNLYIRAKKEKYKNSEYTSGRITTKNSLNFTYGIIEAKIKFPLVNGVSPGMWLSGTYNKNIWPYCGEIDALIVTDSIQEISSGCTWDINKSYYKKTNLDLTQFNEYTIVWDKNYITVYVDDLEIYKIDITPSEFIAFHHHFFLNLNVLIGGYTVNQNVDNSAFPVDMIIDYIKIYQYDLNNNHSAAIEPTTPTSHLNNFDTIKIEPNNPTSYINNINTNEKEIDFTNPTSYLDYTNNKDIESSTEISYLDNTSTSDIDSIKESSDLSTTNIKDKETINSTSYLNNIITTDMAQTDSSSYLTNNSTIDINPTNSDTLDIEATTSTDNLNNNTIDIKSNNSDNYLDNTNTLDSKTINSGNYLDKSNTITIDNGLTNSDNYLDNTNTITLDNENTNSDNYLDNTNTITIDDENINSDTNFDNTNIIDKESINSDTYLFDNNTIYVEPNNSVSNSNDTNTTAINPTNYSNYLNLIYCYKILVLFLLF